MLEDHIVPWMKRWKVGCGYMGEQGAESLHASFNNSERANNMVNRVERFRAVLQNHHLKLLPSITSLKPPPETINAISFIKVMRVVDTLILSFVSRYKKMLTAYSCCRRPDSSFVIPFQEQNFSFLVMLNSKCMERH